MDGFDGSIPVKSFWGGKNRSRHRALIYLTFRFFGLQYWLFGFDSVLDGNTNGRFKARDKKDSGVGCKS